MPSADKAHGRMRRPVRSVLYRGATSRALLGSLSLHAALGIGLWEYDRTPTAGILVPPPARPIELRVTAALPAPPVPRAADPVIEPAIEPRIDPEIEPVAERMEPDSAAAEPESESEQAEEPATEEAFAESTSTAPPESEVFEREPLVPDGVDMEAVRRDAIARIVATLRADAERRTFSVDDLPGAASESHDDGEPSVDIFTAAAAARGDGLLARGRARSRIVRNAVELCNQLTGGFSLFGLADFCADPAARADLFGHLRPEYMESVPLCTAEEELQIEVEETGAGAFGEFKCVLIPREVRAEYYSRYDPELAGWLRAEEEPAAAPVR